MAKKPSGRSPRSPYPGAIVPAGDPPAAPTGAPHGAAGYVVARTQSASFSGPLPHPDMLKQYEAVLEGAANRIILMAEKQSAHRQDLERRVVVSDIHKSYWGLVAAFVLALASTVCGSLVADHGQPWAGGAIATATVVALVTVFLKETRARREERVEKAKHLLDPGGK